VRIRNTGYKAHEMMKWIDSADRIDAGGVGVAVGVDPSSTSSFGEKNFLWMTVQCV
jgi:hypothetical protein